MSALAGLIRSCAYVTAPVGWKGEAPSAQFKDDDGALSPLAVRDLGVASVFIRPDVARETARELASALRADQRVSSLLPSADTSGYLRLGAALDDQGLALSLLAIGEHLGWWKLYTPRTVLGDVITDEMERAMIGQGYLSTDGTFLAETP